MYRVSVVLFSKTVILFRSSVQSPNNSFCFRATGICQQSRLICRVSVDFGSRLRSMVPVSKSFHNVAIFGHRRKKKKKKKKSRRRKERNGQIV